MTNEPFADVDIEQTMSDTELTGAQASTSGDSTNDQLQANVRMGGYTTTILLIFALQMIFCFGICCYTQLQIKNAKSSEEKQKAEFYTFLYDFHQQMAYDESAISN